MMNRLLMVALIIGVAASTANGQRGGGGHGGGGSRGGFSGGVAAHSASAFRGGSVTVRTSGFAARQPFSSSRYVALNPDVRSPVQQDLRGSNIRRVQRRPYYYPRSYVPAYGAGVVYGGGLGYFGPDCVGYGYCNYNGGYGDAGYSDVAPADQAVYPGGYGPPPDEQVEAAPMDSNRPAYQAPQPLQPAAEPLAEDTVTLIFMDGRPPLQIHNYMLTRTTLYVQEQRIREIPVDQLDIAATEKVNQDAGVDFKLPSGR